MYLRHFLNIFFLQFSVLNTNDLGMSRHKIVARFGLMHMVATNLCEWLYVIVEETKHEIFHISHSDKHDKLLPLHDEVDSKNLTNTIPSHVMPEECRGTNIMGSLVQDAAPFLFPCTIEYSLICAVILYHMWKKIRSISNITKFEKHMVRSASTESIHHFTIDCSRANQGVLAGVIMMVMTIICLIIYFMLHNNKNYTYLAIRQVTYYEIALYTVCSFAVVGAFFKMKDLKFSKNKKGGSQSNFL